MKFKRNICHIVAASLDNVIGIDGEIPWDIPEDLIRFKEITMFAPVIMGRKTAESIGRLLPNRYNIIVSKSGIVRLKENPREDSYGAGTMHSIANSVEDALDIANDVAGTTLWKNQVFIIGGQEIYGQTADLINTIVMTRVNRNCGMEEGFRDRLQEQDIRYYNMPSGFKETARETHGSHTYINYVRENNG